MSQDEKYYRSIYSGKFFGENNKDFVYKIEVKSKKYLIDLNEDGKLDSLQTVKKDGTDFIRINDEYGRKIFEQKLETKGFNSSIYRASLKKIARKTNVLILHFYEGENKAGVFESSARLYFVTIPMNDFTKITLTKGPFYWSEKEGAASKYWARRYTVNTVDLNKDGIREIATTFNSIQKVYFYQGDGIWKTL